MPGAFFFVGGTVVEGKAAQVDHAVDLGGAAQDLATRAVEPAPTIT